ncbi:Gldg family protein [Pseudobacter ginsenosidimutans]|uniref:ABC-2 type transport system permease protein n=1 Tax=Pseudobacter ginsenosidimutans TaxID=661488 RepID=A0A4Q7MSL4_9BACT|nr:Gldg family protein [Pseudobacter ginsenosidimutans]QEC42233.1 ABC transporter permease subunit [Pseudobacter ginsenosidimutans]RZS70924.1 ABC-2 type transport system permease protein [Pseudobacter ginsenosidimutans]
MKVILDITSNELRKLFYSPIAWFVMVIFAFQGAGAFAASFGYYVHLKNAGALMYIKDVTYAVFSSEMMGMYGAVPSIMYLFIPLITMNAISREKGTGGIKLLYSSPVSNSQIILGKYLALVLFILLLVLFIFIFGLYGMLNIANADKGLIFCGLLGLFLLGCVYAALGLFMSSITVYPIVAAISTMCLLAFLHFADHWGQGTKFIRDITYWLSLKGRVNTFIKGMITTEDVIYFIAVIAFALSLAVIKLNAARTRRSRRQVAMQYIIASLAMAITGYVTSMPSFKFYHDVTHTQRNTISEESQKVMRKVEDNILITSYTNMQDANTLATALPNSYMIDVHRFEEYTRFKPTMQLDYEYYYKKMPTGFYTEKYPTLNDEQLMDTLRKQNDFDFKIVPHQNLAGKVDLSGEDYRFVREIKLGNGKKTFLRIFNDNNIFPDEGQITAAFKRLVDTLPQVGFVTGHGERSFDITNERGYNTFTQEKTFRYSLINNGFDFEKVELGKPVPEHISILVIADPRQDFTETELNNFQAYVNKGGNLIIAGEPTRQAITNKLVGPLGVNMMPGVIYQPKQNVLSEVMLAKPVIPAEWNSPWLKMSKDRRQQMVMDQACPLEFTGSNGFVATSVCVTDTTPGWVELESTDFENNPPVFNPAAGEKKEPFSSAMALSRKVNQKQQKILVTGDADWMSNMELQTFRKDTWAANFEFICTAFYWLSDGKAPINTSKPEPIDNDISVNREQWKLPSFLLKWGVSFLLLAAGVTVWVRRRRR